MAESILRLPYDEIKFTDADVVDAHDWIPADDKYNPHNVRPWLLHDHGFTIAVVFACCAQDAIDVAVDANKLDRYLISDADLVADYDNGEDEDERVSYLGNASEPFNIETLGIIEIPNPPFSFCAQLNAMQDQPLIR